MTTLTAYLDMRVLPINSDVFFFLANAEMARQDAGVDWFRVVVVPGPDEGFRKGRKYQPLEHHYRFRNMLVPAARMFDKCAGVLSARSIEEAKNIHGMFSGGPVYPLGYKVEPLNEKEAYVAGLFWRVAKAAKKGRTIPSIKPSEASKNYVRDRLSPVTRGRDLVTITLREAPYKAEMNSDAAAWGNFVSRIDQSRFFPVLVRDTYQAFGEPFGNDLDRICHFPEAALDIDIRAALYEHAYLNLWTGNGASWSTSVFNPNVRFLEFKILGPNSVHSADHFRQVYLLEVGEQLPFFTPFQRITWEDEQPDVMVREFHEMVGRIDKSRTRVDPAAELARWAAEVCG